LATFISTGGVSESIKNVWENPRVAYGGGVRFRFNKKEKIAVRFDYGAGKDTQNFYFTIGEAF
jgi:outer membrane translocation and assembly module TamA